MKKTYLFLCLSFVFGVSVKTVAQTDPGTANLTHQWTFDDGTANDVVGTAIGTLQGNAVITGKALNTLNGGYLSLPAAAIGINSYTAITAEAWFTSASGQNTGYTMLSYFGNTTGTTGTEYVTMTAARGDGFSRAAISTGNETSPWGTEDGVNSAKYDDGLLHHMVSVYDTNGVTFYIDGALIGTTPFTGTNAISSIGTQFAYLDKSGYTGDPTWKGSIHKFSLYNTALTADNVLFLFQHGAEAQSVITSTVSSLAFDSNYPAEVFNVTSANLASDITVTAPAGILIMDGVSGNPVTTITKNTANVALTVVYDGTVLLVDGNITLTSGSTVVTIPVKSADDATCYVPMYPNGTNLIENPEMNSLSTFQGWGAKSVVTIITDPTNVYCGAQSIEVGNGVATGSLDQSLTGLIVKNAVYKVRAMVKTMDGGFNFGTGQTDPEVIIPVNTNGEWQQIDFSFSTGANMGATPLIYFNDYNCTGRTAYIDNYQVYLTENPVIVTSVKSYVADDKSGKNFKISTTSANLTKDITITAPAGIVLSKSVISKDSLTTQTFTATYDGTTAIDGNIVLTSDTIVVKVAVLSDNSSACFTPLYTDKPNILSDPYMNNTTTGWGSHDLILAKDYPDSVFCGVSCGRIIGSGDFDIPLTGKIKPNTNYVAKAMVLTLGSYHMGVFRVDSVNTADITDSINTNGTWQAMTFYFTTGVGFKVGSTQGMFFNNMSTGRRAFIDNWELYEAGPSALPTVSKQFTNIYIRDGKIVATFELENASLVQFDVYNVQGMLLSTDRIQGIAGGNSKVLSANLQSGVYLVKMTQNNQSFIQKLVK